MCRVLPIMIIAFIFAHCCTYENYCCSYVCVLVICVRSMCQFVGRETKYRSARSILICIYIRAGND